MQILNSLFLEEVGNDADMGWVAGRPAAELKDGEEYVLIRVGGVGFVRKMVRGAKVDWEHGVTEFCVRKSLDRLYSIVVQNFMNVLQA